MGRDAERSSSRRGPGAFTEAAPGLSGSHWDNGFATKISPAPGKKNNDPGSAKQGNLNPCGSPEDGLERSAPAGVLSPSVTGMSTGRVEPEGQHLFAESLDQPPGLRFVDLFRIQPADWSNTVFQHGLGLR